MDLEQNTVEAPAAAVDVLPRTVKEQGVSRFDLDPTALNGALAGFDESRQIKWMSRRTFTSFYLRDLCNQVDVLHKADLW